MEGKTPATDNDDLGLVNRSVVERAKADTGVANPDSAPQEAFEDELDAAMRPLCRRTICPMSIPVTSPNAT